MLVEYYSAGDNGKFAEKIGIAPQTLSTWKARSKIDYEVVYSSCEGLDANWLLTGKGDMLLNKTSPESEDTRDVNNAGNNREDVMSLLLEIKSGQDILLANFSKVLKIDEQVPEQPSDKSPQGDLVKKALEKLDDLKSDLEDK